MTGSHGDDAPDLASSSDQTVIEELVPASARRPKIKRGERPLLEVKGLRTSFRTRDGVVRAVDGIDFHVDRGEIMGLVGESGCGKSVSALSIMRLVPDPPGRIVGGSVTLEGTDLLGLNEAEMRKIRGNRISMIFQEPMTSLNPVMRIGDQITEAIRLHREIKPIPICFCKSSTSARIWACIVTSRAVVGSSAINKAGRQASAIAIIARWRIPPDN
jgi:ABC-type dipeptide/oligopeptide/nickel transport system ATPase component